MFRCSVPSKLLAVPAGASGAIADVLADRPAVMRLAVRRALGHGGVRRVAAGTGYSVQHTSRILGGHRPQLAVWAWAAGAAGLPLEDVLAGQVPAVSPPGLRLALRGAYRAGQQGRPIDGPAWWETWRAAVGLWSPHTRRVQAESTKPHPARRHRMGRGEGTGAARGRRPELNPTAPRPAAQGAGPFMSAKGE